MFLPGRPFKRHRDTQQNNTKHNDIQDYAFLYCNPLSVSVITVTTFNCTSGQYFKKSLHKQNITFVYSYSHSSEVNLLTLLRKIDFFPVELGETCTHICSSF